MQQQTVRKILFSLSGGILCVLLLSWYWNSFNASRGFWEVEIGNEGPHLALTLRLERSDSGQHRRRIVFKDVEASTAQSGIFKLPEEAENSSGIKMIFHDITLRPGQVTLDVQGHEIVILTPHILINDQVYAWDQPEPIEIID